MMRLLFAETFRMGDCLYTAALIDALKQAVDAEFHVIVSELSGGFDFIWDRLGVQVHRFSFPWEKSGWQFHPVEVRRALQRVRKELRGDFSGAHGFNPRGFFLQTQVLKAAGAAEVISLEFAEGTPLLWRFLGRDKRNIFDSRQKFLSECILRLTGLQPFLLEAAFLRRYIRLQPVSDRVLLSPGASSPIKFWEEVRWTELAGRLLEAGCSVEAVTHPSSNVPDSDWPSGVRLFSGGVRELSEQIGASRLIVSPDSFAAHLAACTGVPSVVLFGSQSPELWSPPGAVAVVADDIPCRPCSQRLHRCKYRHRCMTGLSVEKVLAETLSLING